LRARGVDVAAFLPRYGIAPETLEDLEARLPLPAVCRLWDDAAVILHEPNLGIAVGARPPIGEGVIAYGMQACPTLGDAWRLVVQFHRLMSDVIEPRLVEERGRARFSLYTVVPDPRMLRHISELILSKALLSGRTLTGLEWNPIIVRFRHPRPPNVDEHRSFFRAPLIFDHAVDELEIERGLLQLPLRGAEPRLLRFLDRYAADVLSRLPPASDFTTVVRFAVATSLRHQEPTLQRVAGHFHMTARTLQRRLAEAGLSFRALVDNARHELALRYLERDDLSIAEVGLLLGFDSKTSFHRAFRRWTGATPAELRRRLKQEHAHVRR
jgi:AraC-like DNA-binding protein